MEKNAIFISYPNQKYCHEAVGDSQITPARDQRTTEIDMDIRQLETRTGPFRVCWAIKPSTEDDRGGSSASLLHLLTSSYPGSYLRYCCYYSASNKKYQQSRSVACSKIG